MRGEKATVNNLQILGLTNDFISMGRELLMLSEYANIVNEITTQNIHIKDEDLFKNVATLVVERGLHKKN